MDTFHIFLVTLYKRLLLIDYRFFLFFFIEYVVYNIICNSFSEENTNYNSESTYGCSYYCQPSK